MKCKAFTLAEVLVTLGILGIVAALTMPTLISSHRNKVLANQAKNSYNILLNSLDLYKQQNNCFDYFCLFKRDKSNNEIANKLATVLKVSKVCNTSDTDDMCKKYPMKANKAYKKDGKYASVDMFSTDGRIVLTNGSYILIKNYNTCKRTVTSIIRDDKGNEIDKKEVNADICTYIYIDSNGFKGPNQKGADIYVVALQSTGKIVDSGNYINTVFLNDTVEYEKYTPGKDVE